MAETAAYTHPSINLSAWEQASTDRAVLIADGHDIRITVRAGHLNVTDGPPGHPRTRKIPRLPRTYSRLLILAGHGLMSAEVIRWLHWAELPWSMLDVQDSSIIAASGSVRTDARLLRAQAYAPGDETGLRITRDLITAKLSGQAANLRDILRATGAARMIDEYADELKRCETLDDCRTWEGQAAIVYWQVWAERVHVPFSPHDLSLVPALWHDFTCRSSLAWDGYQRNKDATDPADAMLNYLYRIAETEAVHACHALGLHPALGILHADKAGRDSLALDLIEAVRPHCDRLILAMLDCGTGVPCDAKGKPRYLDRRWLTETREGRCRLVPPLTHQLASHAADLGAALRPHAESAARILAGAASGEVRIPRARKTRAERIPVSSYRPARLRDGVTADELLPDDVWTIVRGWIPEPLTGPYGRKRTGRPHDTAQDRAVIAALAGHELLGIPWGAIPVDVSSQLCQARLKAWQWSQINGQTAWEHIADEIQRRGHLSALVSELE